ncbi:MAG: hypothetical protein HYT80_07985 [Euryarchaeota archaeon]|nr:hypothetical protein [Euryarchaeota archaeon]
MPRARKRPYTRKERVGITPDPRFMAWVFERVGPGNRFASVTHAFECGIVCMMERERELKGILDSAAQRKEK